MRELNPELPVKYDKLFYVPNATLILILILYARWKEGRKNKTVWVLLNYFLLLAGGAVIKELFYSYTMKWITDYVWGGLLTIGLIYFLWAVNRTQGKNFGKG